MTTSPPTPAGSGAGDTDGFNRTVVLPPELKIIQIKKAIEYIERETSAIVEVYYEQANVFSGLVGIFGVRALDSFSPYRRNKHHDVAQQRFPDLSLRGRLNPSAEQSLESKGSTRAWALQSHYNNPGWYIVWRYLVDATRMIEPQKAVVVWRVDVVFLQESDWKYEGSNAGEGRGGRTHTFGVKLPATRLANSIVYQHRRVTLRQGRPTLANGGG